MAVAYLDTQIAVWLYHGDARKLTRSAGRIIDSHDLLISPMVYLEFDYLLRSRRVDDSAGTIFSALSSQLGIAICGLPFSLVADLAIENGWTSDPFDKIIAAQARANQNAPLITSDETIRANYANAVW